MVNTFLTPIKRKDRTLTEKQQKFLDCLIATNGDPKQAATLAGYNGNHYQVISSLKEEIIDLATNVLANSAPEAAFKLVEIMKTDKLIPQLSSKLQAAQTILDRVGVVKKERLDVSHTYSGGIFILPAKDTEKEVIEHEASSSSPSITEWENEGGS